MEKIVISGGSRGIGKALVENLLQLGHTVFTLARSGRELSALERQTADMPGHLFTAVFDMETGDFARLSDEIRAKLGSVSCVVNNAGLLINKPFEKLSFRDVERVFRVNVLSVFPFVQMVLPFMTSGGHIVNITSMGGFQGSAKFPGLSAYSAAKGALSILTESLSVELAQKGIKVNALALGAVQTEMLAAAFPGYHAPVTPEEMATFIADFTLNGHHYFNGKILPVSLSSP